MALIARRVRGAAWLGAACLVPFAVADLARASTQGAAMAGLVKLGQLLVALTTVGVLARRRSPGTTIGVAVWFLAGTVALAAVAASLRGEVSSLPLFAVLTTLMASVLLPWGVRAQLVVVACSAAAVAGNAHAVSGLARAVPYPALPLGVMMVASVWVAHEGERRRRETVALERARAESERRFRATADSAPVLIWMTDRSGRLTYANRGWHDLLGAEPHASDLFAVWRAAIHEDDLPHVRRELTSAMRRREPFEVEYRIRARDGAVRWLLVRGTPQLHPDGHDGYVGSGTDVTVLKDAARALDDARAAALETSRLKSEFLANMSHEIRTPMNGVFGMTEIAIETDDAQERHDCLLRARDCAMTLMALLDDILDFSKIEAGKLEVESIGFSPQAVIDAVLDTLTVEAHRKGLELVGWVHPSVPASVRGDPGRLRQVLLNLGSTAVKFTEHGEVTIALTLDALAPDGAATLRGAVRDTGIGIPPDKRATIFESFTQGDGSMSRRYGGSGLGLAIAHRLVGLMGGDIAVESEAGRGSTFSFTIECVAAATDGTATTRRLAGVRVLVVEDNASASAMLTTLLEAEGCQAQGVATGAAAVALAGVARFDVALVDQQLPDRDAGSAARLLEILSRRVPHIVGMTVRASPAAGPRCAAVIPKPIRRRDLVGVLTQVMGEALPERRAGAGGR